MFFVYHMVIRGNTQRSNSNSETIQRILFRIPSVIRDSRNWKTHITKLVFYFKYDLGADRQLQAKNVLTLQKITLYQTPKTSWFLSNAQNVYGKTPIKTLNIFFLRTSWPMSLKLGRFHQGIKSIIVDSNGDPEFTFTYFTARSNFIT